MNRERKLQSMALKAQGTLADKYTSDDVLAIANFHLCSGDSIHRCVYNLRNRAMHLMAISHAYRGNNLRAVELSDLQYHTVENWGGPGVVTSVCIHYLICFIYQVSLYYFSLHCGVTF